MRHLRTVRVPAGRKFMTEPREAMLSMFEGTGIPGYFLIASELLLLLCTKEIPERDYRLVLYDERAPREDLHRGIVAVPSLLQVLWAIGFANTELTNAVCEKPIRFAHRPFRVNPSWRGKSPLRQIAMSRNAVGYTAETVCVTDKSHGFFWAYLSK